jgi:hypothetical protein
MAQIVIPSVAQATGGISIDQEFSRRTGDAPAGVAGEAFTPVHIYFNNPFDLSVATVRFVYADSDPLAATVAGPLRLWLKDGDAARDGRVASAGGDFIGAGDYSPSVLGMGGANRTARLYIEGARPTASDATRNVGDVALHLRSGVG